jgi:hypothetical protein
MLAIAQRADNIRPSELSSSFDTFYFLSTRSSPAWTLKVGLDSTFIYENALFFGDLS